MKQQPTIEQILGQTFDAFVTKTKGHSKKKAEFIFHMTDWRSDLEDLASLYCKPNAVDREAAQEVVIGFIAHAVSHANAARRLFWPELRDPFAPKTRPKNKRIPQRTASQPSRRSRARTD